jgi:hypothetical protein
MNERHRYMKPDERLGAYLGDGVYASFDGWHVWLRTDKDDQVHEIALEPAVFNELKLYVEKVILAEGAKP